METQMDNQNPIAVQHNALECLIKDIYGQNLKSFLIDASEIIESLTHRRFVGMCRNTPDGSFRPRMIPKMLGFARKAQISPDCDYLGLFGSNKHGEGIFHLVSLEIGAADRHSRFLAKTDFWLSHA